MGEIDTVAVIGAGRMGSAMVGTLRREGFDVVVYNRTPERAQAVADATGARVAASAADAASHADVVIASLADDAAVEAAYTGDDGIVAGLSPETVVLESSTITPSTLSRLEPDVRARGAWLLDSPVSGSVQLVEQGALTIMVGGEASALESARPVLDALAKNVFHMGALGTGATMKLAVNALVLSTDIAVAESLVLAERAGIERSTAYEVLASGAGASPFVLYKREAFERPDDAPVAFSIELSAKDLELILALARDAGLDLAQARTNHEVFNRAVAHGLGGSDMSAVAVMLRDDTSG